MSEKFCVECGTPRATDSRFCGSCGARFAEPVTSPPPSTPVAPDPGDYVPSWRSEEPAPTWTAPPAADPPATTWDSAPTWESAPPAQPPAQPVHGWAGAPPTGPAPGSTSGPPAGRPSPSALPLIGGPPLELWAAIALLAVPGGWLALQALLDLDDVLDVFDFFGSRFGFLGLMIIIMWVLVGLIMVGIAAGLLLRMKPSQVLVGMLVGLLLSHVIFIDSHEVSVALALAGAVTATVIVWVAPAVRSRFVASGGTPPAVIAVELSMTAFAALSLVGAVLAMLLAKDQARYGVLGALVAATGVAMAACVPRIARAHVPTRLIVSALGVVGFVLPLTLGGTRAGMSPLPGLAAAIVATLWLANGSRTYFGDRPIDFHALTTGAGAGPSYQHPPAAPSYQPPPSYQPGPAYPPAGPPAPPGGYQPSSQVPPGYPPAGGQSPYQAPPQS